MKSERNQFCWSPSSFTPQIKQILSLIDFDSTKGFFEVTTYWREFYTLLLWMLFLYTKLSHSTAFRLTQTTITIQRRICNSFFRVIQTKYTDETLACNKTRSSFLYPPLHVLRWSKISFTFQSDRSWHFPTLNSVVVKFNFFIASFVSFSFLWSLLIRIGRLLLIQVNPGKQGQENDTS